MNYKKNVLCKLLMAMIVGQICICSGVCTAYAVNTPNSKSTGVVTEQKDTKKNFIVNYETKKENGQIVYTSKLYITNKTGVATIARGKNITEVLVDDSKCIRVTKTSRAVMIKAISPDIAGKCNLTIKYKDNTIDKMKVIVLKDSKEDKKSGDSFPLIYSEYITYAGNKSYKSNGVIAHGEQLTFKRESKKNMNIKSINGNNVNDFFDIKYYDKNNKEVNKDSKNIQSVKVTAKYTKTGLSSFDIIWNDNTEDNISLNVIKKPELVVINKDVSKTFEISGKKEIASMSYDGVNWYNGKTDKKALNKLSLVPEFKGNTVKFTNKSNSKSRVRLCIRYKDWTSEYKDIIISSFVKREGKIMNVFDENTSDTIRLYTPGKRIKEIVNTNKDFKTSLKYWDTQSKADKDNKAYGYLDVTSVTSGSAEADIKVVYTDNSVDLLKVKAVRVSNGGSTSNTVVTNNVKVVTNTVSEMTYEDKIVDILSTEYTDVSNAGIDISSYYAYSPSDVSLEKVSSNTLRIRLNSGVQESKINIQYVNGKTEVITVRNIDDIDRNKLQVNSTVTYYYNKPISGVEALEGGNHVSYSINGSNLDVTGVSADSYSLGDANVRLKVKFSDGTSQDLNITVAWTLASSDPYYRNGKWSYDSFIPTGIVNWGGKRFSWYTMLATNSNATGVSWQLPITNNPGNILSYLPQSDWDRLAEMQKTNPYVTMQDAFKPWSTDSVYWVDEGFIRDNQGYIVVAAPLNLLNAGVVQRMQTIATPWGPARIYDACPEGSWDIWVRSHNFNGFFNYSIVKSK